MQVRQVAVGIVPHEVRQLPAAHPGAILRRLGPARVGAHRVGLGHAGAVSDQRRSRSHATRSPPVPRDSRAAAPVDALDIDHDGTSAAIGDIAVEGNGVALMVIAR